VKRIFIYVLVFFSVPTIVGLVPAYRAVSGFLSVKNPDPITSTLPQFKPPINPKNPYVAVLVSNQGTEVTDLLTSYAILSASRAFNVFTVAPEKVVSPVTGGLEILPHYSFGELEGKFRKGVELIVVPAILDHENPTLVEWLNENGEPPTNVLSICEGARTVAAAGLLKGKKATSHFFALDGLEKDYPETEWQKNVRFVRDGNILSSAGVTAAMDATFQIVKDLAGERVAEETANKLGFFVGSSSAQSPTMGVWDVSLLFFNAGYKWNPSDIGVVLFPGVEEIHLAAMLDIYPRTLAAKTITVSSNRTTIPSKYRLNLDPQTALKTMDRPDRVLVPNGKMEKIRNDSDLQNWAKEQNLEIEAFQPVPPSESYVQIFLDLAIKQNLSVSRVVSKMIEFPLNKLQMENQPGVNRWPFWLLLRPVLLGLVAVFLVRWLIYRKKNP